MKASVLKPGFDTLHPGRICFAYTNLELKPDGENFSHLAAIVEEDMLATY